MRKRSAGETGVIDITNCIDRVFQPVIIVFQTIFERRLPTCCSSWSTYSEGDIDLSARVAPKIRKQMPAQHETLFTRYSIYQKV
jgi:hypothetical protein